MPARMLIALATLGIATTLNAAQQISEADRQARILTVYQQDLALFEEHYRLPENARDLSLQIEGIAPRLQLDSLMAEGAGTLTQRQLVNSGQSFQHYLQQYLGQPILLRADSGAQRDVTLLGVDGSSVLISDGEYSEQIALGGYWHIALPGVLPAATPPYLRLDAEGAAGPQLRLSYLSNGLSWQASYHLRLNPRAATVRLEGLATLNNNSGIDLENVQLRLLAGSVNQPQGGGRAYAMEAMALRADSSSAAPARTPIEDYHLYTPAQPITLANGQQLGIPLQAPIEMPVETRYRYTQYINGGGQQQAQTSHPRREISFTLPADTDNKTPLPAGAARVFVQDEQAGLMFIGGQQLPASAAGETLTLTLGEAFDLTLEQQQTRFERQGKNSILGYKIELRNSGDSARSVDITTRFNQPHQLLESSHDSEAQGLVRRWSVPVAANGQTTLEYSVRLLP